jgi:type I restriction enzyme S subunit
MSQIERKINEFQEGYKEIQIGPDQLKIPEEWTVTTIEDVATRFISGGTPDSDNEEFWGGDIPWTTCAVVEGPHFDGEKDFITQEGLKNSSASLVPEGSILFGTRVNVANVGRTCKEIAISQDLTGIVLDEEKIDPDFITWYLLFNQEKIRDRYSQGSTIQGMITADLKSLPLLSPPLSEQRRIADILLTVDEKINQTDNIIGKAKELKKGLMQDLLHKGIGHEKFKDMYIGPKRSTLPLDWDVVRLGEIADIQSGSTPKRSNEEYWDGGTIPWIKSGEFNDGIVAETEEYITEKALDETGCTVFPKGTLLIALYGKGTVSKTARLGIDAATNQAIAGLLPESEAFKPRYLQYYLINSRDTLLNVTVNPSSDTGRTNIYMSALRQFKVALPPLEEQEAIAERIAAVDDKISDEVAYKQHLQDLRRSLMQDLLTGKVRVNPN